ncbi:glycosyltransferase family 4 protein [Chitiniphilus shinanonensis]|uniref:glycosyltransferase family 4 protein n=1 Tax=Chitiniphilus shinanonensis TaxID=553088 RepID=UPI0030279BDC
MAKILIISGFADSLLNFRGALIKSMIEAGHQVYACAPSCSESMKARFVDAGVGFFSVPMNRAGLNPFLDFQSFLSIYKVNRKIKPDVVLAYTIKSVVYGLWAARLAGVKRRFALITGLGYAFTLEGEGGKRRLVNRIARFLYGIGLKKVSGCFFQNPDDSRMFRELGLLPMECPNLVVNGSGVDVEHYTKKPLPLETAFLLVARLLADKGIREYVAAATRIKRTYADVRFKLVGDLDSNPSSICETELKEWIDSGVIEYTRSVEDIRPIMEAASVYVLPSYREGMPRTVLEAMSLGRPVITTDAPGCRETVVPGLNGFLVPIRNVDALVDAMTAMIDSPEKIESMGRESRRIAVEKYDVHEVNRIMLREMGLIGGS